MKNKTEGRKASPGRKTGVSRKAGVGRQAKKKSVAKDTPNARGSQRRVAILNALGECVNTKGYAKTTLAEIAGAAGLSPSHVLYYYRGKGAILKHYFRDVADKFLSRLEEIRNEAPKRQIELLAQISFGGRGMTRANMGFMLECFGLAVNDSVLRREKATLDRQAKTYLTELFEKTPHGLNGDARRLAEIAYAQLVGLRTAVYFDDELSLPQVLNLFHASMLELAGYEP